MSKLICLLIVVLFSSSLRGQERTWSDNTGKFNIDAELVSIRDEKVVLRKPDGEEIRVPLPRLSKNDQQFVEKWKSEQKKPPKVDGAPKETDWNADVKSKATAKREAGFDYDFQSKAPLPEVVVEVDIYGKAAAKAISYGKLKIESFKDGKGDDLKISEEKFGKDLTKEMEKVDRDDSFFASHPTNGIRVNLKTTDKSGSVKKVSLVEGKIDVLTGGTPKIETFKDVSTYKNGAVDSDVLSELGVKCEFTRTENQIKLKMEGKANLASMKFVNSKGRQVEPEGWSAGGYDDNWEYSFDFGKVPTADLVLEYRVNPVTVTLLFSAKNVSVKVDKR